MEVKASAKFIRISPRKTRLVIDAVRGSKVDAALEQLAFMNKKAAEPVSKLVLSAVANAVNNFELNKDNLFIKEIRSDEGPVLKRWMPRARGRATQLKKRTSHISIILGELVDSGLKEAKKQKLEAPVKLGERPKEAEGVKMEDKDEGKKKAKPDVEEKGKKIVDPRSEGKGKHTVIEGKGAKGFTSKIFRRKAG